MAEGSYNLDDVREYFEFTLKGNIYRFRHMTTEEIEKMATLEKQEAKMTDYLVSFIDKVDPDAPDFVVIQKQMTIPQWRLFREMVKSEFGG